MDTTARSCVEFWKTWAPSKGLVNPNTATAYRVACTSVLSVLDDWESLDVAALDTEDVFKRFVNLKSKSFTPTSLQTYKTRFTRGLELFLEHAKNPAAWKPKIQTRREKPAVTNGSPVNVTTPQPEPDVAPAIPTTSRAGLVEYPFPLREGRFAYLRLPADLTPADVKRLTAYLNALVLDEVA